MTTVDGSHPAPGTTSPAGTARAKVIRVAGELDAATADQLVGSVSDAAAAHVPVVVDMAGVSFLDVAGSRGLLAADAAAHDKGADLVVDNLSPRLERVLEVVAPGQTLTAEETRLSLTPAGGDMPPGAAGDPA